MKLFFALGTRPEAIKLAPLILCCRHAASIDVTVCNTGQHKSMARDMLGAFGIDAEIDLDIMRPGQSLTDITTNILRSIEGPLKEIRPHWIVVQGDTTTSFAAALAAFYQKIPVAHIEAGLRTGDRYSPWPEEINRRLNTALATLHFAPTERSRSNLLAEGVAGDSIVVTGNTGIDALFQVGRMFDKNLKLKREIVRDLIAHGLPFLSENDTPDGMVVVTAHRRENFGAGIASICEAIVELAEKYPALKFIFPVHPNPEVIGPVDRIIKAARKPNVFTIAPLDYLPFTYLLRAARLIISDSGGIQEEAIALGKRLVVLRDSTERTELVGLLGVSMVGTDRRTIVEAVTAAVGDKAARKPLDIFGDGLASQRIVDRLKDTR